MFLSNYHQTSFRFCETKPWRDEDEDIIKGCRSAGAQLDKPVIIILEKAHGAFIL